jgi:hypothetical protein
VQSFSNCKNGTATPRNARNAGKINQKSQKQTTAYTTRQIIAFMVAEGSIHGD